MLRSLGSIILTFFELLLLAVVLAFYTTLSSAPREGLQGAVELLPPGACTTIYSPSVVFFNGTARGHTLTLCRNSTGSVEVVNP